MTDRSKAGTSGLTGRIQAQPSELLSQEVLNPQLNYELQHYLHWYVFVEKALVVEYERMGCLDRPTSARIAGLLNELSPERLSASASATMSDIAFGIERYVIERLDGMGSHWHLDRSRNDFQACAQLMFARHQLYDLAAVLHTFVEALHRVAERTTDIPMPGYTHYQAAQVISPAFYLTALVEGALTTSHRLLSTYDDINLCPLGAGAMAGQELRWNRQHLADLLGFTRPQPHALVAVASRDWVLRIAGELSVFSLTLSRFATDLMTWGSSEYGYIDLPDELTGISSAMPQKRNFTIFERIRGKTAHITSLYLDFCLGQRNTPFTNLVEVSKEASTHFYTMITTFHSALRLFTLAVDHLQFHEQRMEEVCTQGNLWASRVANWLTIQHNIPHRTAQAIVGKYIATAVQRTDLAGPIDIALFRQAAEHYGYAPNLNTEQLEQLVNVRHCLESKQSAGSTHPQAVSTLIETQQAQLLQNKQQWQLRRTYVDNCYQHLEAAVSGVIDRSSNQ